MRILALFSLDPLIIFELSLTKSLKKLLTTHDLVKIIHVICIENNREDRQVLKMNNYRKNTPNLESFMSKFEKVTYTQVEREAT